MCHLTLGDKRSQNIIIVLHFTWVGIQINDKTDYKSHSLQLGLFTPKTDTSFCLSFLYEKQYIETLNAPIREKFVDTD